MRRTILLSGAASLILGFTGSIAANVIAVPRAVEAQVARIRAEQFTLVGPNGADRVNLLVGPGPASTVQVLDTEGVPRAWINTGSRGGDDPDHASFVVVAPDGRTTTARLGMGDARVISRATSLRLSDLQGNPRVAIRVEEDGSPSMRMFDAAGNVTWSAP